MKIQSSGIILLLIFLLLIPLNLFGKKSDNLKSIAVRKEKPTRIISGRSLDYLNSQKTEIVNIWVFFNDKAVFNDHDFKVTAGNIHINKQAQKRRAKMNINNIVFADLPVSNNYIKRIESTGAKLRRESRWLNAASFGIKIANIGEIEKLPFVNRIKPVVKYKRIIPSEKQQENIGPKFAPSQNDALDYGASLNQMNMINAPAMHELGYNGQGVIVTLIDSGYRKSHNSFSLAYSESRVLAEYDFVFNDSDTQNEPEDVSAQHNHGTSIWSALGGYSPGFVIGPAYGASFLLAKTEDLRDEYVGEEDNWVAALEWADSLGTDVVSTSLGYVDWYTLEDFDGATCITTLAANTAASLGIVPCKSVGNRGPTPGAFSAPADAHNILACGAVDSNENIASFSSRGPTYDGRMKPEVCAQGVSTRCATGTGDNSYGFSGGTSLSTPLVGGAATVLLSANPTLTPLQVRTALMATASQADTPDNTYGWGVVDLLEAFNWGANFTTDITVGVDSLTVNFTDSSITSAYQWKWYFGDGDSSSATNPTHNYIPGTYDVTLIIESGEGTLTRIKESHIYVADEYIRGDANNSRNINLLDVTYLIAYLYKDGPAPIDFELGDANSSGDINLLDVTFLIAYLYKGGPSPF